jgi:hypothetical protein
MATFRPVLRSDRSADPFPPVGRTLRSDDGCYKSVTNYTDVSHMATQCLTMSPSVHSHRASTLAGRPLSAVGASPLYGHDRVSVEKVGQLVVGTAVAARAAA